VLAARKSRSRIPAEAPALPNYSPDILRHPFCTSARTLQSVVNTYQLKDKSGWRRNLQSRELTARWVCGRCMKVPALSAQGRSDGPWSAHQIVLLELDDQEACIGRHA
jgi:hypothetical protein